MKRAFIVLLFYSILLILPLFTLAADDVSVIDYGAIGNDQNDDSAAIQNAIDTALTQRKNSVYTPKATYILNKTITIPGNLFLNFHNSTFITTINEPSKIPTQFIKITGSNVRIKGFNLVLKAIQLNRSSKGRAIEIGNGATEFKDIIIEDCSFTNSFYGIFSQGDTLNNLTIRNNYFQCLRRDILLNKTYGKRIFIENNTFGGDRTWTTPVNSQGEIGIFAGISYPFTEEMNDSIYEKNYIDFVYVLNNRASASNSRFIEVVNCINVNINGNSIKGAIGHKSDLGVSDDTIVVDLCRNFRITNNITEASGENGIDILASKYGVVANNLMMQIDDNGISFDRSDIDVEGKASSLSDTYRIPSDVAVSNNVFNCKSSCLSVTLGWNINMSNNILSFFSSTPHYHFAFNSDTNDKFIRGNPLRKIKNVICAGNVRNEEGKASIIVHNLQHIVWGTVSLGQSLAVESDWIDINKGATYAYIHNKGLYQHIDIYFYLDPNNLGKYGTELNKHPSDKMKINYRYCFSENQVEKIRGVWPVWQDIYQVIIKAGDYLVDVPERSSGPGIHMGFITSGKIKIVTY